jgi:hypothetical protein
MVRQLQPLPSTIRLLDYGTRRPLHRVHFSCHWLRVNLLKPQGFPASRRDHPTKECTALHKICALGAPKIKPHNRRPYRHPNLPCSASNKQTLAHKPRGFKDCRLEIDYRRRFVRLPVPRCIRKVSSRPEMLSPGLLPRRGKLLQQYSRTDSLEPLHDLAHLLVWLIGDKQVDMVAVRLCRTQSPLRALPAITFISEGLIDWSLHGLGRGSRSTLLSPVGEFLPFELAYRRAVREGFARRARPVLTSRLF